MKGFKNAKVYTEDYGVVKTSLGFDKEINFISENGVIDEIIELPENAIVLPGFIDQHIHGSGTADAMDGTVEALATIADSIACEGTTAFLATTMTQSVENITKSMIAVNDYKNANRELGAKLLGIHLEGPYINKSKAGAQPAEYIVAPSLEQFENYNSLSGNSIKIVSLAPENDGAMEFITYLKNKGINPSIGHTSAKYAEVEKAIESGAVQVTHTYNAQSAFNHREVGVIGSALIFDELACEIICDLIHVSIPALKLLFKNKPKDKVIL
ncbi:MAG: amidohydrolase family protein, partial [Clostridia bacterium]|nr:amidohydrolase family protein [Clostridia bacterium]